MVYKNIRIKNIVYKNIRIKNIAYENIRIKTLIMSYSQCCQGLLILRLDMAMRSETLVYIQYKEIINRLEGEPKCVNNLFDPVIT